MSRSFIRRKTDSSLTKKVRRRFRAWSWNSFPQSFYCHLFLSVTSQARVPECKEAASGLFSVLKMI